MFRTPQQCVDDFVVANSRSDMKRCLMVGGLQRREKTALEFSIKNLPFVLDPSLPWQTQ